LRKQQATDEKPLRAKASTCDAAGDAVDNFLVPDSVHACPVDKRDRPRKNPENRTVAMHIEPFHVEQLYGDAEQAIDTALMCLRHAVLCHSVRLQGRHVARSAGHLVDVAQHAGQLVAVLGQAVSRMPLQVLPLLDAVSQHCDEHGDLPSDAAQSTQTLARHMLQVVSMGEEVVAKAQELSEQAERLAAMIQRMNTAGTDEAKPIRLSAASVDLARTAGHVASLAAAAVLAVGQAHLRAGITTSALEQAVTMRREQSACNSSTSSGHDSACEESEDSDSDAKTEDSCDDHCLAEDTQPEQGCEFMWFLNREVVALQRELRDAALADPSRMASVTEVEKETLFALLAEVLASQARVVLNSVTVVMNADGCHGRFAMVEEALGFFFCRCSVERDCHSFVGGSFDSPCMLGRCKGAAVHAQQCGP